MLKKITKEKYLELEKIAEGKLDGIRGRVKESDYDFLLQIVIKEIAIDMGYTISEEDFEANTEKILNRST